MPDFDEIYRTYFNDVFLYIRRLSGGDESTAEEITSETFFKALRAIDKFRGDCDIRVWLCQIAKNCYYTHIKKAGRTRSIDDAELNDIPGPEAAVEERVVRSDQAAQVRKVLHDLPDTYKEVFMWRVFGELSFEQIGGIFRKTGNWACVTYHRARKMIRERMEEQRHEK